MIGNSVNGFFVLLFGATGGAGGECAPYAKPSHIAADLQLASPFSTMPHTAVDDHLCEAMQ